MRFFDDVRRRRRAFWGLLSLSILVFTLITYRAYYATDESAVVDKVFVDNLRLNECRLVLNGSGHFTEDDGLTLCDSAQCCNIVQAPGGGWCKKALCIPHEAWR
jgi:hypothetical protein